MQRIAVLTSGGDAPGMNAAIRAVVRTAAHHGIETLGVRRGYLGLIRDDLIPLGPRDVGGIIGRGGTILASARCPQFKEASGREMALDGLRARGVDGLVVIGGNGSQTGAHALSQMGLPVVGVASTIDNDLIGSDVTIGVDTALNIALEAIDRLRVTASSHHRATVVEVMGRDCGYLAVMAGIAGGAEAILIPEAPGSPEAVVQTLKESHGRGKVSALIVVAEGATPDAEGLIRWLKDHPEQLGYEVRATILGHVQRGGTPTAADRLLGSRLGAAAVERLVAGQHGVVVGQLCGEVAATPLADVVGKTKAPPPALLELARVLER